MSIVGNEHNSSLRIENRGKNAHVKSRNSFHTDVQGMTADFFRNFRFRWRQEAPQSNPLAEWEKFYRDFFKVTVDLSDLWAPSPQDGFNRLIVVIPGITIERVLAARAKRFKVFRWAQDNLDQLTESHRSAIRGPYAVWVHDWREANGAYVNKSYDDLMAAGIHGVTLLEQTLDVLKYHSETNQLIDTTNWTMCSGSLCWHEDEQGVPVVYSDGAQELYILWYKRGAASGNISCREVVQ